MVTKKDIEKHNKLVKDSFERAKKGEVIDLTELMISKEEILLDKKKKQGDRK